MQRPRKNGSHRSRPHRSHGDTEAGSWPPRRSSWWPRRDRVPSREWQRNVASDRATPSLDGRDQPFDRRSPHGGPRRCCRSDRAPTRIAVGEGGVWLLSGPTLVHVDEHSKGVESSIGLDCFLTGSFAIGYRIVWISGTGGFDRIDPATNEKLKPIPVPFAQIGGAPAFSGIAVGAKAVWGADYAQGNIARVDVKTSHRRNWYLTGSCRHGDEVSPAVFADNRRVLNLFRTERAGLHAIRPTRPNTSRLRITPSLLRGVNRALTLSRRLMGKQLSSCFLQGEALTPLSDSRPINAARSASGRVSASSSSPAPASPTAATTRVPMSS